MEASLNRLLKRIKISHAVGEKIASKAKHAFQVVYDMEYVESNCFDYTEPVIVPAKTFLAQLV